MFSTQHLDQLRAHGIAEAEGERQLALLRTPPAAADLRRPCTVDDGIRRIETERDDLISVWQAARERLAVMKFVPASGAATRMFRALHALRSRRDPATLNELRDAASDGDADAGEAIALLDRLDELALCGPLSEALGRSATELAAEGDYLSLLDGMLDEARGLGLGALPKGLIPYHRYADASRTALEEHLIEGRGYLGRGERPLRFHFTVSSAHRPRFEEVARRAQRELEAAGQRLEIAFSIQDPATDTIAVDAAGDPLSDAVGDLVFRPAGHGALLANLARLEADVVIVKNIDNVVPEPAQGDTIEWKRTLAGLAVQTQKEIFAHLAELEAGAEPAAAWRLVERSLPLEPPTEVRDASSDAQRRYLIDRLDRPLRVCGMVKNEGEPGGGPFWVTGPGGEVAAQIVESAQVDFDSKRQASIWRSSTHFNPVDLVCCLKDRHGERYDVERYCDPGASFVAGKSFEGQPITVLERPGLWNGSMAGWNTIFVEVPITTFAPVKTILDLLKPQHRVTA